MAPLPTQSQSQHSAKKANHKTSKRSSSSTSITASKKTTPQADYSFRNGNRQPIIIAPTPTPTPKVRRRHQYVTIEFTDPIPSSLGISSLNSWSEVERRLNRRLVAFTCVTDKASFIGRLSAHVIPHLDCAPKSSEVASCIYVPNVASRLQNTCIITSFDFINLIAWMLRKPPWFLVDERNRVRRNLEIFRPETLYKEGPYEEWDIFKQVTSYQHPKPWNIQKDFKVFDWSLIEAMIREIMKKYIIVVEDGEVAEGSGPKRDDIEDEFEQARKDLMEEYARMNGSQETSRHTETWSDPGLPGHACSSETPRSASVGEDPTNAQGLKGLPPQGFGGEHMGYSYVLGFDQRNATQSWVMPRQHEDQKGFLPDWPSSSNYQDISQHGFYAPGYPHPHRVNDHLWNSELSLSTIMALSDFEYIPANYGGSLMPQIQASQRLQGLGNLSSLEDLSPMSTYENDDTCKNGPGVTDTIHSVQEFNFSRSSHCNHSLKTSSESHVTETDSKLV